MNINEFREKYCRACGSIICAGTDDMLEGCSKYREEFKQDPYEKV